MFQKIIGIIGAIAVVGAIVMVAVSPKADGFFPDMFERIKRPHVAETVEPPPVQSEPSLDPVPQSDTLPLLPEHHDEQAE